MSSFWKHDLAYEYLSSAAQCMLGLAKRPAEAFLTWYPAAREEAISGFCCAVFASGQTQPPPRVNRTQELRLP